jgi:predicted DNA-binding WGR domain protein
VPRYEFSEGSSNKFWEIELDGSSFTTTYGRIGTDGKTTIKEYDSDEQAKKEHDKLVAQKVKKGYELVDGDGGAAPKPAAKKKVAKKKEAAPKAAASAGALRYELVEGKSSKFWEIQLQGTSFTTTYGRIGTDGKTTIKEYDSEEQARKEYDKIIASKVKKGYELVS